jgi:GLPGLI family protein
MMKNTLFFLLICLGAKLAHAQNKAPILEVRYQFTHIDDTNHRDRPQKEEMHLYVTPEWSVYLREALIGSAQYFFTQKGGKAADFNPLKELNEMSSYIHYFDQKEQVYTEKILNLFYQISEPLTSIDWTIHEEKKQIQGYEVQKATAQVRGRHYTAWFCTALPYQAGPWKLHGLPGLILAAEDQQSEVVFELLGIEKTTLTTSSIERPKHVQMQKINQQAYNKVYAQFQANPAAFAKATLGDNVVMGASASGGGNRVEKKWNNPIEQ